MPENRLLALVLIFAPLSVVSIGGGPGIFAEMQRQAVTVQGWMTNREYVDLFAISRAAPGPGTLIVALIGWKAAGLAGAVVAALALYVPAALMMFGAGLWWRRPRGSPLRDAVERGLAPVAVGLILAGSLRILVADRAGVLQVGTAALSTLVMLHPRASPYALLAAVAALYGAWAWMTGMQG